MKLRTINHVKRNTKGWTVGPLDFCGVGRVFTNGGAKFVLTSFEHLNICLFFLPRFVALCAWHPALMPKQKDIQQKSWNAKGIYKPGVRKLALTDIPGEAKWRTKHVSDLKKRVIHGDFPGVCLPLPASFISTQLIIIRAQERHRTALVAAGVINKGVQMLQSKISNWRTSRTMKLEDRQMTLTRALKQRENEIKAAEDEITAAAEEVKVALVAALEAERVVAALEADGYTMDVSDGELKTDELD